VSGCLERGFGMGFLERGFQVGVGVLQKVHLTFACVLIVQGSCSRCYALGERKGKREYVCVNETLKRDRREGVSACVLASVCVCVREKE